MIVDYLYIKIYKTIKTIDYIGNEETDVRVDDVMCHIE